MAAKPQALSAIAPERALHAVLAERQPLSPRQIEVTALVVAGQTDKEIGLALRISKRTVRLHLDQSFAKTGTSNRTELAAWAQRNAADAVTRVVRTELRKSGPAPGEASVPAAIPGTDNRADKSPLPGAGKFGIFERRIADFERFLTIQSATLGGIRARLQKFAEQQEKGLAQFEVRLALANRLLDRVHAELEKISSLAEGS